MCRVVFCWSGHYFTANLAEAGESLVFLRQCLFCCQDGGGNRLGRNEVNKRFTLTVRLTLMPSLLWINSMLGMTCRVLKIVFMALVMIMRNSVICFLSIHYTSVFQPFCCSGTFLKCLRCSWNHMQWTKCLCCYNGIELWLQILSQTILVCFGRTTGSHSQKPEVLWNLVEKHCITPWNIHKVSQILVISFSCSYFVSAVHWKTNGRLSSQNMEEHLQVLQKLIVLMCGFVMKFYDGTKIGKTKCFCLSSRLVY